MTQKQIDQISSCTIPLISICHNLHSFRTKYQPLFSRLSLPPGLFAPPYPRLLHLRQRPLNLHQKPRILMPRPLFLPQRLQSLHLKPCHLQSQRLRIPRSASRMPAHQTPVWSIHPAIPCRSSSSATASLTGTGHRPVSLRSLQRQPTPLSTTQRSARRQPPASTAALFHLRIRIPWLRIPKAPLLQTGLHPLPIRPAAKPQFHMQIRLQSHL